jgi:HEAT repeat protein
VREEVVRALGTIGADREVVLPLLRAKMTDPARKVALEAAIAVAALDPEDRAAEGKVVAALDQRDLRQTAAKAIKERLPSVRRRRLDAIGAALKSDDRNVRLYLMEALGPEAAPMVAALVEVAKDDPDGSVHRTAWEAVGRIGGEAAVEALSSWLAGYGRVEPLSAPALEKAAADVPTPHGEGSSETLPAARALIRFQPNHAGAQAALGFILGYPRVNWADRRDAAEALASAGAQVTAAQIHLRALLRAESQSLRHAAAVSLARIGLADGVSQLAQDLTAEVGSAEAAEALGRLGPAAKAAVPALEAATRDPREVKLRRAARAALQAVRR